MELWCVPYPRGWEPRGTGKQGPRLRISAGTGTRGREWERGLGKGRTPCDKVEKIVEVPKIMPQERVQNRTVEQIVDVSVLVTKEYVVHVLKAIHMCKSAHQAHIVPCDDCHWRPALRFKV